MRKIVWVYWENIGKSTEPAHITLSRWSMIKNLSSCTIIFVTPENVEKYLPGINKLVNGLEVDVQGRLDRFFRRFMPRNRKNVAVKCDIIRAFLLYYYGGIYIDADAIVLSDFDLYFDKLKYYEFFISQRSSYGKTHMSVGFYGSVARGAIISEYVSEIKDSLSKSKLVYYNDIGSAMITRIVEQHIDTAYVYPEHETQPITFEDSIIKFLDNNLNLESVVPPEQKVFMLFNDPFKGKMRVIKISELYYSDMFISKVFRKAITQDEFESLKMGM